MNEQEFVDQAWEENIRFFSHHENITDEETKIYNDSRYEKYVTAEIENPRWSYVRWMVAKLEHNKNNHVKSFELQKKNWEECTHYGSGFELVNLYRIGLGTRKDIVKSKNLLNSLLNEHFSQHAFEIIVSIVGNKSRVLAEKIKRILDTNCHELITSIDIDEIFEVWDL